MSAAGVLWMAQAQESGQAAPQAKGKKGGRKTSARGYEHAGSSHRHARHRLDRRHAQLELRDSLKAGNTTTVLIFAGGMEDNGPYITVSQHNSIVRAMCDSIARKLGNALCAPIVGMAPGDPETSRNPGSIQLSAETYKGLLSDTAASLKPKDSRT